MRTERENEVTLLMDERKNKVIGALDECSANGICGWVVYEDKLSDLPDKPIEVNVFIDGELIARTVANIFRPDLLDAQIGGGECAFNVRIPNRFFDRKKHSVEVRDVVSGLLLKNSPNSFLLSPAELDLFYVESGNTLDKTGSNAVDSDSKENVLNESSPVISKPKVIGALDECGINGISGWATYEDQLSEIPSEPIEVDIFIDGEFIARATANIFRQDLLDVQIGGGQCAFNVCIPDRFFDGKEHSAEVRDVVSGLLLEGTPKSFLLFRINLDSICAEQADNSQIEREYKLDIASSFEMAKLGQVEKTVHHKKDSIINFINKENVNQYEGYVFAVKYPILTGWVWDKSQPEKQLTVAVKIGGKEIATVVADQFRNDIFSAGKGDGKKAFTIKLPDDLPSGEHNLTICISDSGYVLKNCPTKITIPVKSKDHLTELKVVHKQKPIDVPQKIEGKLEKVDFKGITGWAWDANSPDEPLRLDVIVNGELLDSCVAATHRQDLEKAGKGNGKHAFRLPLPPYMCDGKQHTVSIKVANSDVLINKTPVNFSFEHNKPYNNYEEFFDWSLMRREIYEPIKENDMRVIGYMNWYKDLLTERYRNRNQKNLVSIIMPAFNRSDIIRTAILSILAQAYENWELIIVDDGSTDNTVAIAKTFKDKRIQTIVLKNNVGVSKARNEGLKRAKGKFFAYLDSDNTWDELFLLIMVNTLLDNAEYESIYCAQRATEIHASEAKGEWEFHFIRFGPFHRALLENRNFIDLNCFIHHRSLYDIYGGFDEEMRRLVDWELIIRYTQKKFPLPLPCILTNYYYGKVSNQITTLERLDTAETLYDKRLRKDTFTCSSLPTAKIYGEAPDYEFFHTLSTFKRGQQKQFVSIIITSFEAAQYLDYCIASVLQYTGKESYEVIVVDNASSTETVTLLNKLEENHDNIKVIYNPSNTGFTYASNQGIQAARPDSDIILLNNDAVVTEGWVPAMQDVLSHHKNIGIVVPRQTLIPSTPTIDAHVPYANPRREIDVSLSTHHANILDARIDPLRGYVEIKFAPFFCVYITRECIQKAGLLNARDGRHYRSDRLYCDVVREYAGMKIVYTPHSKLYHFLQQSTKHLKGSSTKEFQKIFVDNVWDENEKKQLNIK